MDHTVCEAVTLTFSLHMMSWRPPKSLCLSVGSSFVLGVASTGRMGWTDTCGWLNHSCKSSLWATTQKAALKDYVQVLCEHESSFLWDEHPGMR